MPGRIALAEHERLAHLTAEQVKILADEIDAAAQQVASGIRHQVVYELAQRLVVSHSQILAKALVDELRRRRSANGALARMLAAPPISTGPVALPRVERN